MDDNNCSISEKHVTVKTDVTEREMFTSGLNPRSLGGQRILENWIEFTKGTFILASAEFMYPVTPEEATTKKENPFKLVSNDD